MSNPFLTDDYRVWLSHLKTRFRQVQIKAAVAVNAELLQFYWELGKDIVAQQIIQRWGSGFLENLSQDLMQEFPDMKGFSKRNLEQIRRWYTFWSAEPVIAKQVASHLFSIPWWHNVVILTKCKSHAEALYYVFYHTRLHCYVVVELKTVDFEPEFAGKLNFYLKAVDEQLRNQHDAPTIGLLLCKSKDKLVAEYALSDMNKPLGLATYQLSHTLPVNLQDKLPSIEVLEAELKLMSKE